MKLLFIVDPLASLKAYKDSSVAMMRAATAHGHAVFACEARHLFIRDGYVRAVCAALDVRTDDDWYRIAHSETLMLKDFNAVLMRTDPPVDTDYLLATHLLSVAERNGAQVLNRPACLRDFNEKLAILNFPQFVAPTLVSAGANEIDAFLAE
ncbi:MAG: glutathione synthase, partial [Thiobacillus sp.]|nr:glutathione synthase [Thiobacillus sp.]